MRSTSAKKMWQRCLLVFCVILVFSGSGFELEAKEEPERAKWSVKKGGFFKNRSLKKQLDLIFNEEKAEFTASDIEDAALILISYLETEGYLAAKTLATITLVDGTEKTVEWDSHFDVFLPRDTSATFVRFDLIEGPGFYYQELEIVGNQVLAVEEVEAFFFSEPFLFQSEKARLFTPGLLQRGGGNLQAHLNHLGYKDALVKTEVLSMDKETGACLAQVVIDEGVKHYVKDVTVVIKGDPPKSSVDVSPYLGQPYNRFIAQDIAKELRNRFFEVGYPDTVIKSSLKVGPESKKGKGVEISIEVEPGVQVFVSSITFVGSEETKPSLIRSRLKLNEGDPLNPSLLEDSRLNLSRLGVFDRVTYNLEPVEEKLRSVEFSLTERTTWNVDMLFGWGSYEQLRGGFVVEKMNIFGLGHRARLKTIASMKSYLGEVGYLVPEIFGTPTSLSVKVFALEREEIAFVREDFGLNVGLSRQFERMGLDVDTVYSLKNLDLGFNNLGDELANQESAMVGSLELRLGRDRRDSALNPREGYRIFSRTEWAAKPLGGEVDYQRAEFGASMHGEISRGLFWHAGLTHGVIGSFAEAEKQVPASVLFYPGGESSIRGYQRTEAAPRDTEGKFIGARAYTLLNLELEQLLSDSLSLVLFVDGLGTASTIEKYPYNDTLASVGLGLRFKTFMGPIRFEYGHNLNPRALDPEGTFHFSLGYPF